MGFFAMLRVIFATARAVRASKRDADRLSTLPMAEFLTEWVAIMSQAGDGTRPRLRRPAESAATAEAEQHLACRLPDQLREFYGLCDGIDWSAADYRKDISSLAQLAFSSAHRPPLGAQLVHEWETWGREQGEPRGLKIFSISLTDLMADNAERVIPFSDVDDMLALEAPESGSGAVMVIHPHPHFAPGTVLEVENLVATRYDHMKNWLASSAAAISTIASMSGQAR